MYKTHLSLNEYLMYIKTSRRDDIGYFLFQLIKTKFVTVHDYDKIDCLCFGVHME